MRDMPFPPRALGVFLLVLVVGPVTSAEEPGRPTIDFNRDIRPILSNSCFQCHGPDAKQRKGTNKAFRLDTERGAFVDLGGYTAIVRTDPDQSELVRRITTDDPTDLMPPRASGKTLSTRDVAKLTEWVRQGRCLCQALVVCQTCASALARPGRPVMVAQPDRRLRLRPPGARRGSSRRPRPTGPP